MAADQKIMANNGESQPNKTKEVSLSTEVHNSMVPGDFHDFPGSQAKMYTTYANRQETIAKALGTKAPLVS